METIKIKNGKIEVRDDGEKDYPVAYWIATGGTYPFQPVRMKTKKQAIAAARKLAKAIVDMYPTTPINLAVEWRTE